jgi:hypothetical protein
MLLANDNNFMKWGGWLLFACVPEYQLLNPPFDIFTAEAVACRCLRVWCYRVDGGGYWFHRWFSLRIRHIDES